MSETSDGRPDGSGALEPLGPGVHLLRGGDLGCARLLILLGRAVRGLPAGAVVQLETTDPVAPIDLPAWCRLTGHDYLGPVAPVAAVAAVAAVATAAAARYAVRVSAQAVATHPHAPWRPIARD